MIRKVTVNGVVRYRARLRGAPQATFLKLSEAQEYEAKVRRNRTRAKAGLEVEKEAITYDQLCELYLAAYTRKSKPWTVTMLKYSRAKWGKVFVRQLEPEMIGPWLQGLPHADKTKHHILERMRAVCEMGVEWGYLSRSPVRPRAVSSPGQERVRPIRPFELWSDVEAMASAMAEQFAPWGPLVRFVCSTGLRPGEWAALTWRGVIRDDSDTEVMVPGTKNENAQRTIPLSQMAVDALGELPRPLRVDLPVFTTKNGKPFTKENYRYWQKRAWRQGLLDAGMEHRDPYEMRHTFATLALQAGVPLDVVSKLMGHASVEVTRKFYAKYTRTTLRMYVPLLNQIGESDASHDKAADAG
jgi:integrase